jgi:hypothetical protein
VGTVLVKTAKVRVFLDPFDSPNLNLASFFQYFSLFSAGLVHMFWGSPGSPSTITIHGMQALKAARCTEDETSTRPAMWPKTQVIPATWASFLFDLSLELTEHPIFTNSWKSLLALHHYIIFSLSANFVIILSIFIEPIQSLANLAQP